MLAYIPYMDPMGIVMHLKYHKNIKNVASMPYTASMPKMS